MPKSRKFYTCKYDRPFKEIFLNEDNIYLLKGLLETILRIKIEDIKIKQTERNTKNLKISRKTYDALIYTKKKKIEIEVNSNATKEYIKPRNASYIFDLYSHHTLVGEKYTEKTDIIQINLSYGIKENKNSRIYKVRDEEGKEYIRNFYIYEINMENYKKLWYDKKEDEIKANTYLIMLDLEKEELKKLAKKNKEVGEYMEKLEKLNEDPEFYQYMTKEEDERKIQNTLINEALESGLKQGKFDGLLETAQNLLKMNMSVSDIIKVTNLTKEQIEKLK